MLFSDYYYQEKDYELNFALAEHWNVYTLVEGYLVDVSTKDFKNLTKRFQRVMKAKVDRVDFSGDKDEMSVKELKIIPFKGTKTILFNAIVNGSTDKEYKTVLSFEGVEYFDEKKRGAITVKYKGNDFHFKKLNGKQDLKSRCNCPDFRFRAAEADRRVKGLITVPKFPRYIPKGTGAPVNPRQIALLCKHLWLLYDHLKQKKYLVR